MARYSNPKLNNDPHVVHKLGQQGRKVLNQLIQNWILIVILVSVLVGILLRLRTFMNAGPLFLDENLLALNILHRSYRELLQPLDYNQAAPLGFLWLLRWQTSLSSSPYLLRLFPLSSAILALVLFPYVSRKYISLRGTLVATIIAAFSVPTLVHTSEIKQYSVDILATVIALGLGNYMQDKMIRARHALVIGFIGAVLIWFSHPVIFVLAGVGLVLFIKGFWIRNKSRMRLVMIVGLMWLISFLASYLLARENLYQNVALLNFWRESFPPPLTQPLVLFNWLREGFFLLFRFAPLYFSLEGLAASFFLIGIFSMIQRDKWQGSILLLPLALTMLASFLHLYPISDRLTLFMGPIIMILVGEGTDRFLSWPESRLMKAAAVIVIILLLYNPINQGLRYQKGQTWDAGIQEAMEYLHENLAQDDLFLYVRIIPGRPIFLYLSKYPFPEENMIVKFGDPPSQALYAQELSRLGAEYGGVWLFFSIINNEDEEGFREHILSLLENKADSYEAVNLPGTEKKLYRFDFGRDGNEGK